MSEKENSLTKAYDLMLWLFPQIGNFPKNYRYILGNRMENGLLDVYESLVEAQYSKDKEKLLHTANISLEKLRLYARLCMDLRFINAKKYEYLSKEINMIGMFVGGWIKKTREIK